MRLGIAMLSRDPPSAVHESVLLGQEVVFGEGVNVGPHCVLTGKISIGRETTLVGGSIFDSAVTIGDGCRIESNVSITHLGDEHEGQVATTIGSGAKIGAGSALLSGISIGSGAVVTAGSVVTSNVPAHAIVTGNPAVIVGYTQTALPEALSAPTNGAQPEEPYVATCHVKGVTLHQFRRIRDLRGDLSVGEFTRNVPFQPKRYFIVLGVPNSKVRGEHAHRTCEQFLIAVAGSVSVLVDDGKNREELLLDRPTFGVYIPPRIWATQYKYSKDAVLLVFASEFYEPSDYIREYSLFLREKDALP